MHELFPVLTGLALGAGAALVGPRRNAAGWAVLAALVVGFLAAFVSGELALSAAFLVFDVGQVLVATLVAHYVTRAVVRRRASGA